MEKNLIVFSHGVRYGVTGWQRSAVLLTNRSEAVRFIGGVEASDASSATESISVKTVEVKIDEASLGHTGFVALLWCERREVCGRKERNHEIEAVAGDPPLLSRVFFREARLEWLKEECPCAQAFLSGLHCSRGFNSSARRRLAFALGVSAPFARHDDRRKAWRGVLRGLRLERRVKIPESATGLNHALPVETAMALGFRPQWREPEPWSGVNPEYQEIPIAR